jgi:hypothetical protein
LKRAGFFQARVITTQPLNQMISPAITAIIIAVLAALAFVGGFAVSDWRSAAEIRRLNSDNALLSASNNKCAEDIQSVRTAMDALIATSATREKNAAAAMRNAGAAAAKHVRRAEDIRSLAPVASQHHCEAIAREQADYIRTRRQN